MQPSTILKFFVGLYVRAIYCYRALRDINRLKIGDVVMYSGYRWVAIQGVADPFWNIMRCDGDPPVKGDMVRVHKCYLKLQPLWRRFRFSFMHTYRFYMGNWYQIDVQNRGRFMFTGKNKGFMQPSTTISKTTSFRGEKTETLISLETAKLSKEKGFDWPCKKRCNIDITMSDPFAPMPTQSHLQKWLRDVHGWHILVIPVVTMHYTFKIMKVWKKDFNPDLEIETPPYSGVDAYNYRDYEEALEAGLLESLKLVQP